MSRASTEERSRVPPRMNSSGLWISEELREELMGPGTSAFLSLPTIEGSSFGKREGVGNKHLVKKMRSEFQVMA